MIRMKPGDYVDVHFEEGCQIGRFVSDEGDTVSVLLGTATGEYITLSGIPKNMVALWMAV